LRAAFWQFSRFEPRRTTAVLRRRVDRCQTPQPPPNNKPGLLTGNLEGRGDPACLFLDGSASEAQAAGLTRDGLISCYLLTLMSEDPLQERIGRLSTETLAKLDACLKTALGLP
jgi:hypothetical protein